MLKTNGALFCLVPHSCYDDPDIDCSEWNYTNCPELVDHYTEEDFHRLHCPRSCGYCPLLFR